MGVWNRIVKPLSLVPLIVALTACTSGSGDAVDPMPDSGRSGCGDEGSDGGVGYPAGPFGTSEGQIIPSFCFTGYGRPADGTGEARLVELSLRDFYNPTGDATYGPGSPFGEGEPKPKALLINGSALWCNPCKNEAAQLLPGEYAELHPRGMEFMVIVVESASIGEPATFGDLDSWIGEFAVNYAAVLDPINQMAFRTDTFPANALVKTADMTIVKLDYGIPQDSFWAQAEGLLDP
jgi:hypothetical protein